MCKIEGLFLILNKTEQLSCFTRVLLIKIQKKYIIIIKIFLIPFIVKLVIVVFSKRKKLLLNLKLRHGDEKKYLPYLNKLSKLGIDSELKLLRICAGFYVLSNAE